MLTQGISIYLFIGFHANSELKMHLAQSKQWKDDIIFKPTDSKTLKLIRYKDKDYFGKYLPEAQISLTHIPPIEKELRSSLETYCPKYRNDKLLLYIFSQPFIK